MAEHPDGRSTRREFLGALALPTALSASPRLDARRPPPAPVGQLPEQLAHDEDFWREVQRAYTIDRTQIYLNSGGTSPSPVEVQDGMRQRLAQMNEAPSHNLWQVQQPRVENVRDAMARFADVPREELAFTRNASESLQTVQFGIDLTAGDEVLCSDQDYPRMLNTFRQRERRERIRLVTVALPGPDAGAAFDDRVVRAYIDAITDRTKLILVSHMVNLTGHVLPAARIAAEGTERGIPVLVDGAHSFAHFPFRIQDLGCDYFGTSLHKWLGAPHGTGLLYVRRDRVRALWPLMAAGQGQDDDIRKFEQIGTYPVANRLGIADALAFHAAIGTERTAARLVALRERWIERIADALPGRFRLHTSRRSGQAYGIANFAIDGIDNGKLGKHLLARHRIITAVIRHPDCSGIRVSPGIYTTPAELDRFADAVIAAARKGLPG